MIRGIPISNKTICDHGILLNIIFILHYRDHVSYPGIRSNDIDRLATYKDLQTQKNLSFPPISQDNQKQNTQNVR